MSILGGNLWFTLSKGNRLPQLNGMWQHDRMGDWHNARKSLLMSTLLIRSATSRTGDYPLLKWGRPRYRTRDLLVVRHADYSANEVVNE